MSFCLERHFEPELHLARHSVPVDAGCRSGVDQVRAAAPCLTGHVAGGNARRGRRASQLEYAAQRVPGGIKVLEVEQVEERDLWLDHKRFRRTFPDLVRAEVPGEVQIEREERR